MRVGVIRIGEKLNLVVSGDGKRWSLVDSVRNPGIRSAKCLIEKWAELDRDTLLNGPGINIEPDFCCPISTPEKIICVGKNYADHAREMGAEAPQLPIIFSKYSSSLIGPGESIQLPTISDKVDFEAELVVVIGKSGFQIDQKHAMDHVFGFTIGNDVSARDWQKGRPGGQWLLGKTFDTFAPVGPYIVTADEIDNAQNLEIELKLNGQTMQSANTSQMIFPIDFLVAHVSKFLTIRPGDLLFTGTPSGVGAGRNPEVYLKNNDEIVIEVSSIGKLVNAVVQN